ncbi:MAG: hypothetical protein AB7R89_01615 [Dehalococcoidia bacterium]
MTRRLAVLAVLISVIGAIVVASRPWSHGTGDDVTLTDLAAVEKLRTRFNQDTGMPRLVLLLSPT